MSWPRALLYAALGAVFAAIALSTVPPAPAPIHVSEVGRWVAVTPAATPARPAITAVLLEARGQRVQATRAAEGWEVTDPPAAGIPADLVAALVSAVLETPAEPIAFDGVDLAEFGLDQPSARMTFDRAGSSPVTVTIGTANPAETGVYGRVEGSDQILLLGLNVRYYIDLVLRAASPSP